MEPKHKRHQLKGDMDGFDCIRVKNDWLLIFAVNGKYLTLAMLGKHTRFAILIQSLPAKREYLSIYGA